MLIPSSGSKTFLSASQYLVFASAHRRIASGEAGWSVWTVSCSFMRNLPGRGLDSSIL